MKKRQHILPSAIWVSFLLAFVMLTVVFKLSAFTDEELRMRGSRTGYGTEKMAGIWVVISILWLFVETKFIAVYEDHILVYNIFGFKRRLEKAKIKCIQFVRQKEIYYILIIMSNHETFGGYNQKVLSFAYCSPIKVVHLVISSKKWKRYYDFVSRYYSNTSFFNCDKVSRIK